MKFVNTWLQMSFMQKFFVIFLICSGILWTVVPATYHSTLHFDPAETLMWGSTFNWGNAKHPPMAGYMLYNFCRLWGFPNFSIFLLSQICVTIGLVYIYKLARCFYDRDKSVIATLLITFYFFYNYETPKFNANIPHLLFVPMMCYYFYRGCVANKWHHWILLAVSTACACLSKYSAGVMAISFCLFLAVNKDARKILLSVKPYAAGLLLLGLLTPHLLLLIKTDFLVFNYVTHGEEMKYGYVGQLCGLAGAIALPLLCMSTAWFICHVSSRTKCPSFSSTLFRSPAFQYSGSIIWGQAAFLFVMGICGHRLSAMWVFPLFLTAGIFIMSLYPAVPLSDRIKRSFCLFCSVFAAIMVLFPLVYYHCNSKYRYHIAKEDLKNAARDFYLRKTGKEIPFISGSIWEAGMLQNCFKYTIKAAPSFDRILMAPHLKNISEKGALLITLSPAKTSKDIKQFFDVELQWHQIELKYCARFGNEEKFVFYLAVLPPTYSVN